LGTPDPAQRSRTKFAIGIHGPVHRTRAKRHNDGTTRFQMVPVTSNRRLFAKTLLPPLRMSSPSDVFRATGCRRGLSTRTLSEALRAVAGGVRSWSLLMSAGYRRLGHLAGGVICCPLAAAIRHNLCVHTGQRAPVRRARICRYRKWPPPSLASRRALTTSFAFPNPALRLIGQRSGVRYQQLTGLRHAIHVCPPRLSRWRSFCAGVCACRNHRWVQS